MKKSIIFAATLLLLTMVSCNKDSLTPSENPLTWDGGTRAEKNPLDEIDFSALDTAYFVTDKDIEAYIHFKELLAKGQGKEFAIQEIVPLGLNDKATLAYLLNYKEGWEILSADKRAPLLLGSDEQGNLSVEDMPDNVKAWVEGLELDILRIRTFSGRPVFFDYETWEKALSNDLFWKAINADEEFITLKMEGTRHIPDSLLIDEPFIDPHFLEGHWELTGTSVEYNVLVNTDHLTQTTWGLGSGLPTDYNMYCPNKQDSSGKVPATSVAVSGAQMAYFLHYKTGKPVNSPSSIYCTATVGDIHYGVNMYIEGYSSSLWSSMSKYSPSTSAAKLIAGIGVRLQIPYGDLYYSFAPSSLKSDFFDDEDIPCDYLYYNTTDIDESLENGMPVIVYARGFEGWDEVGFFFIIDRYQFSATKHTFVYEWVYDTPGNGTPRPLRDKIEIEYSNPTIMQYGMNWGLDGNYNSSFFSKTGTWEADDMIFPSSYTRNIFIFQE